MVGRLVTNNRKHFQVITSKFYLFILPIIVATNLLFTVPTITVNIHDNAPRNS